MGIIRALFEKRSTSIEAAATSLALGASTKAGVPVTVNSALAVTAVWACIRVLAESVAQLPLHLYQRLPKGKERADGHPLAFILHSLANPEVPSFQLREAMMFNLCTWGNGFAEIEWGRDGQVKALWPIGADRVTMNRSRAGDIYYEVWLDAGSPPDRLPAYRMWHVPGLGFNGLYGMSPISFHRESIGLSLATQEYGARFFGNGARPGIILKHPSVLSDTAYARLRDEFTDAHEGLSNAHRVKILEEGMDLEAIGIAPDEAQFLGTREFQVAEIARIFNVPPHMIQDLSRATFSNIEEQGINFVKHSLGAWLRRFEGTITRDLLIGDEQRTLFAEFLVDGFERGNLQSRYQAYQTGVQGGWLSPNDVRALENQNPIENGDLYMLPLNLQTVDQAAEGGPDPVPDTTPDGPDGDQQRSWAPGERRATDGDEVDRLRTARQATAKSQMYVFEDVAGRSIRREVKGIRKGVRQHFTQRAAPEDFTAWLRTFLATQADAMMRDFTPPMLAMAAMALQSATGEIGIDTPDELPGELRTFVDDYVDAMAYGHRRQLENIINGAMTTAIEDGADPAEAIDLRLDEYEENEPRQMAMWQIYEAMNALVIASYSTYGVRYLRWSASGTSCPFCLSISGRIVGIDGYFVEAGSMIPGDEGEYIQVDRNKRHGPLHRGCDCVVVAA